jgi:nondiscriminating aspartyl-tRNA synthetase
VNMMQDRAKPGMLQRVRTTQAGQHVGERVQLMGWLYRLRRLGGINFLLLRDGYGMFQAVIDDADELACLRDIQSESVIEVQGLVVAEEQAPGGYELHACHL